MQLTQQKRASKEVLTIFSSDNMREKMDLLKELQAKHRTKNQQ